MTPRPDPLPDFIILGAMKCGTSTLAAQLAAQDGVFVTDPKEPNFFSDDDIHAKGLDWYGSLFADAPEGALKGEASTHYTKRPDLPEALPRMQAVLAAPRLIYMIRDPVARAVSHYLHEVSQGVITQGPEEAIARYPELVAYGRYGMQIAPYVEAYGREAVLLTSLETLRADPQGELTRIAAHLGHDADRWGPVTWREDLGAQNVSAQRIRKLPLHGLLVGNPVATALRRALVPKSVRSRIRDARQMGQARPDLPPALVHTLRATFETDRERLADLFPGAAALDDAYPFLAETDARP